MNKSLFFIAFIMVLTGSVVQAQDVHFSQFYEQTILRNPALCGVFNGDYKVAANYRNQWSSVSKPYVTGQVSIEGRIPVSQESRDFFSVGLIGLYDKAGSIDMKTTGIYPAVNFSKNLNHTNNSYLTVGFTGGYLQRSFDPNKMTVNNQYQGGRFDPSLPTNERYNTPTINYFDVGAGVSYSSSGGENNNFTYFIGLAGYHFTKPNISFYSDALVNLSMKWSGNAGLNYRLSDEYGFLLQGNYTKQGIYSELIIGGMVNWKKGGENEYTHPDFVLYAGCFYRFQDALIPVVKLDYKRYSFGISYDVNVSKLKAASNLRGGMELSVVKTGVFNDPKWQKSRTTCPHFFW